MSYHLDFIRSWFSDEERAFAALGVEDGKRSRQRLANGWLVRCSAHGDKTPSLRVSRTPTGLLFFCHSCKAGGDFFSMLGAVHGLDPQRDFGRIIELAASAAGILPDQKYEAPAPPPLPPEPPRLDDVTFDRIGLILSLTCPIRRQLDVCDYLAKRGLLEAAQGQLLALPPNAEGLRWVRNAIVQEIGEESWAISGLATESGEWKCPGHRLVIPWRDPDGTVLTIQRRLIGDGKPKYVFPSRRPPRWPYGVERVKDMGPAAEIAWVEGALDVLAMSALAARAGVDRLALGLPGVANWKQPWAAFCEARKAVVALDADDAGERSVEKIAQDLYAVGAIEVIREVPIEGAKDWGTLTEKRRAGVEPERAA